MKTLLIEDSLSDASLLQEALSLAWEGRFKFTLVERLADGLERLQQEHFDVALLDLSLPDSTGADTFRRARATVPHVPIIVLTGADDELIGLEAVRHGIQDYLIKGQADGRQIARAIRYAIERQRADTLLQKAHQELERRVQERTAELSAANRALQAEAVQRQRAEAARMQVLTRLVEAQETERRRVSRELHDQMGQNLTALKLGLKAVSKHVAPTPDAEACLRQADTLADCLMQDIHRLAWELRPAALDDFGLEIALQRYAKEWSERSGVPADFHSLGVQEHRLPARLENTLYRVAQEALTNVARHAQARRVSVLLKRLIDHVSLIVEDDGRGFDAEGLLHEAVTQGHLGLLGMQERVSLAGGTIKIESTPGAGTTLFVRIPFGKTPGES